MPHRPPSCGVALAVGLSAASLLAQTPAPQQPGYVERVEVARVVVDVRVTDAARQPVPDLGVQHFRVRIDGQPVRVETARWENGQVDLPPEGDLGAERVEPTTSGRLIVFFFQKSFEASRMTGLMRMLPRADEFLSRLDPSDCVAVVSFDSHLRRWLDFTQDASRLRRVLDHDLLQGPASRAFRRGRGAVAVRIGSIPRRPAVPRLRKTR